METRFCLCTASCSHAIVAAVVADVVVVAAAACILTALPASAADLF